MIDQKKGIATKTATNKWSDLQYEKNQRDILQ